MVKKMRAFQWWSLVVVLVCFVSAVSVSAQRTNPSLDDVLQQRENRYSPLHYQGSGLRTGGVDGAAAYDPLLRSPDRYEPSDSPTVPLNPARPPPQRVFPAREPARGTANEQFLGSLNPADSNIRTRFDDGRNMSEAEWKRRHEEQRALYDRPLTFYERSKYDEDRLGQNPLLDAHRTGYRSYDYRSQAERERYPDPRDRYRNPYGPQDVKLASRSGGSSQGRLRDDYYWTRKYDPQEKSRNEWRTSSTRYRVGRNVNGECPECITCGKINDWRVDLQGQCRSEYTEHHMEQTVSVKTGYGTIQGFYVYLFDGPLVPEGDRPGVNILDKIQRNVSVFLGVPYATPPVRDNRFKPPLPHKGWGLWQATDYAPACPQARRHVGINKGIREVDEDCLYLNIFTPSTSAAVHRKYPVIIYIHGGHFESGASNLFLGHALAAWEQVVVVTFNYRLGALGFFSTGDEHSPGNYGLLDQALAISWVYENIHVFNGDPRKIVLYGPGAGAASAGLHMVAPKTKDKLFAVFAQGGSLLADWAGIRDVEIVRNTSRVYGERMGCSTEHTYKLVECLVKGRSYDEIANMEITPDLGLFPWGPVVDARIRKPSWSADWSGEDWNFFPKTPLELLTNEDIPTRYYMTGVTRDSAAHVLFDNSTWQPSYLIDQGFMDMKIREYVRRYNYTLNPDGVFNAIKYMYTYWPDPSNRTHIREQFVQLWSDALYRAPVDKAVKLLIDRGVHTYMYVLNTTVEALNLPFWRQIPHDNERYFISGAPFLDPELFPESLRVDRRAWTEGDRNMSRLFMYALGNFAYFGRPISEQIFNINWERGLEGDLRYLNINNTFNTSMLTNYRQREAAFWMEYLPAVMEQYIPTTPPTTEYWWEPEGPVQVAFWGAAGLSVILFILVLTCCCMWCSTRRRLTKLQREMREDSMEVEENFHAFPSSANSLIPDEKGHSNRENGLVQYSRSHDKLIDLEEPSAGSSKGGSFQQKPMSLSEANIPRKVSTGPASQMHQQQPTGVPGLPGGGVPVLPPGAYAVHSMANGSGLPPPPTVAHPIRHDSSGYGLQDVPQQPRYLQDGVSATGPYATGYPQQPIVQPKPRTIYRGGVPVAVEGHGPLPPSSFQPEQQNGGPLQHSRSFDAGSHLSQPSTQAYSQPMHQTRSFDAGQHLDNSEYMRDRDLSLTMSYGHARSKDSIAGTPAGMATSSPRLPPSSTQAQQPRTPYHQPPPSHPPPSDSNSGGDTSVDSTAGPSRPLQQQPPQLSSTTGYSSTASSANPHDTATLPLREPIKQLESPPVARRPSPHLPRRSREEEVITHHPQETGPDLRPYLESSC